MTQSAPKPKPKSGVIATDGTFIDKMNEAIAFSETNRVNAKKIVAQVNAEVHRELSSRYQHVDMDMSSSRVQSIVDARVGQRSSFGVAVSNEQWGYRLATMYGTAELVAAQREANSLQREAIRQQQRTNELLTQMLNRLERIDSSLSDEITNLTAQIPNQRGA